MALQGNLRDFSATEILQLLGTQRKTGCLTLEEGGQKAVIYVLDGRVVSTRAPGLTRDDPLLAFLRTAHRLSDEQCQGILTIQRESGRDFEDLLLNGRYLDAEELASFIERQILDGLMQLTRWERGTYRFDPHERWTQPPLVRLSIEGLLMEAARRADEQKRYRAAFPDPNQVLGVRDLPDPDVALSEEEREIFGIIDGRHTLDEVVAAAPLSEYETYEALQRMVEAGWLEPVGRRAPGPARPAVEAPPVTQAEPRRWVRELTVAVALVLGVALLRVGAHTLHSLSPARGADVYAAAQIRDLRLALDLYRREQGVYPARLEDLPPAHWIPAGRLHIPGHQVRYSLGRGGADYRLELTPAP
ncbi:MAG TPA: DUF4388 domain-containing protein [Terriglobales bacterium]|nr:DUF4388 domain-containing protein [Terriglobales bacterium]